jgi:hypothetical protein
LAATRQLHRNKLLLIVLFERGSKVGKEIGGVEGEGFDICEAYVNMIRL